ncbi:MAG: methyltransferase domain-containing protein [Candidatus Yanofskybacteria bacterium]|nr:methyltransferase domain-containing protein [Candidatus Yanofskybacteria bacterium]
MDSDTSFERFAQQYDEEMGDTGDYNHQHTIDPPLFDLIGSPKGLVIYDIACGNGYIARKLKREGAKEILASDISNSLIKLATNKYPDLGIKYFVREAENFNDIPENYFDLVIIHMAIWYVEGVNSFLANIYKRLKPNGRFIFSMDHPLKWSLYKAIDAVSQDESDKEAEKYLEARKIKTFNNWLKKQDDLSVYFRPMGYYINLCGKNNLMTKAIQEPKSIMLRQGKHYESGIPMKMVIETIKK